MARTDKQITDKRTFCPSARDLMYPEAPHAPKRPLGEPQPPMPPSPCHLRDILVVDDEAAICDVIAKSLKRASFSATARASAKEGLTLRLEQFDLMNFDIMMPDMDGFELCRNVREKVGCPILFLTAKITETDVIQGLAMRADDYIRKPFIPSGLVSRVNAHILVKLLLGIRSQKRFC